MKKLSNFFSMSVSEYADGEITLYVTRMDTATRRMIPSKLLDLRHDPQVPYTAGELLMTGAAAVMEGELEGQYRLF